MNKEEKILKDITNILLQRKSTHGEFKDNAKNFLVFKKALSKFPTNKNYNSEDLMASEMILVKLARIRANPHNKDSWLDIIGYCILRLKELYGDFDG